jgi:hypothetical protein
MEQKLTELCNGPKADPNGSFVLIVCCEGSIAALVQQAGQWTDLRCRSGIGSESLDAMVQIIAPLVQKAQTGTPVCFVHDGNDPKFAAAMMELLSKVGGKDLGQLPASAPDLHPGAVDVLRGAARRHLPRHHLLPRLPHRGHQP